MLFNLYFFFAFLSLNLPAETTAAANEINGSWSGVITQVEGGYRSSYKIDFIIQEKNGVVSGFSYVSVDDIYAKMKIQGTLSNHLLFNARDIAIEEDEVKPGMEWCMKNYILILKKEDNVWKLEGHWNGTTSFSNCKPGKVSLKKVIHRA